MLRSLLSLGFKVVNLFSALSKLNGIMRYSYKLNHANFGNAMFFLFSFFLNISMDLVSETLYSSYPPMLNISHCICLSYF